MALSTTRAALAAALLSMPLAASAQAPPPPPPSPPVGTVVVDGMLTDTPYTLLGTNAGGPSPGFGSGHEVNALYANVDPATGTLSIGVAGNVQDGNRILVFLDTRAGGFASGDFGRTNAPAGAATFNSGTTFDAGFTADYVLVLGTNPAHDNFFADLFTLAGTAATGGGTKLFIGDISDPDVAASPANGSTTQGFEIRLTTSADGTGADLALDRHSVQMFAAYTGESGFLSNQFISPAGNVDGNYGGGAVTFENAAPDPVSYVWQTIAGRKGWRQLAWPVAGGTVANYAAQNFVQGPGTAFPTGTSNVLLSYNPVSAMYNRATNLSNPLESGRGQFWYQYDAADFAGGVVPTGSNFRPRPYTLVAGGVEPQGNVGTNFNELPDTYVGFVMGGNPFSLDFDTQGMALGNNSFSTGPLVYVWDPDMGATGGYVTVDRNAAAVGDRTVAPMQGFWFETRGNPALTGSPAPSFGSSLFAIYNQSARVQGNEAIVSRAAAQRVLAFQLDRLTEAGPVREWSTARLAFVDGAGEGSDAFDGGLPPALDATSDVRVAFVGADGEKRGQESRAYDAATAVAPLALRVAGRPAGTTYRLTWPTDGLPAGSGVTLTDGDTGETVDLRTADHYDFTASAGDWTSRFTVRVASRSTAGEAAPAVAALGTPSPNPASGETRIALTVDAPQHVRAELFDALGRRVALVLDATVDAPRDLAVDVQGLAPGVYVLRVSGDTFAASRRITVSR